jgi:hypothetical protein
MFDRESIDALWGFGLIMGRRASEEMPEYHLRESIRFLDMAFNKSPTNARIIVDLAMSQTLFASYLKSHLSKIDFEIEKGAYNQVIDSSPKEINPERRCTLGE